jgi:uncharacterized protein YgbK (DUF1537 family)
MRIRVIADDLTGAIDGAAPFARAGLPARLARGGTPAPVEPGPHQVLAHSTDTRCATADQASLKVRDHLQATPPQPGDVLVKKIDSLLRGPWGAELHALMDTGHKSLAVVCPALPRMRRTLQGGLLWNAGVRVANGQHFAGEASHAPLDALRACQARWGVLQGHARTVPPLPPQGVLLLDGESEADLDALVSACWHRRHDIVWVGSSGLTAALARHCSGHPPAPLRSAPRQALVLVVGTRSTYSTEQLAHLWQQPLWRSGAVDAAAPDEPRVARCGRVTVILPPAADLPSDLATARIAQAALAQSRAASDAPAWLAVVGGNTLAAVLEQMGADHPTILGSAQAGFEALQLQREPGKSPMEVWSRSGSFGAPEDLWHLCRDHLA